MVQRLQSVLTLYLSGVLAFLGLWWYIYRKKEYHLTDKDDANDETTADQEHLSSPRDVGNCVVENGHSTGMHLDWHAVKERSLVEQELVACQSQPEVRVVAADGLISGLATAAVKPVYESTESSAQVFLETAAEGGPEQDLELQWEHQPCVPSAMRATSHESTCSLSICDLGSGKSKSVGESAGLNQPLQSATLEDITNSTLKLEPAEEVVVRLEPAEAEEVVRLEPAEEVVRLEPAEEVVRLEPAEEVVRLEPAEEVVRLEPAEEVVRLEPTVEVVRLEPAEEVRLEPAEEVRLEPAEEEEEVRLEPAEEEEEVRLEPEGDILSSVEEPTCESSLQADTCLASPSHLITSRVSASKQPLGILRSPQKKESEECKFSRSNTAEINQLVSGLITNVVSAAVSQFLKEKTQLGHGVSPLHSGDPCKAPDHISMDNSEHEMPPLFQEDLCSTTGRENISSSPIVHEDVKHDHSSRAEIETEKIELAEKDSAVGDSGSSSGQTEKVSSGKELSTSMSPQPPRGPAEGLGATSMFLTNGWWMATVPGSGVNNMDCVDGYCQHEARDNKHSSPSLPSQLLNTNQAIEKYNQSHNRSQSPTVWEIEVPKHFVGRLIGKKGRHVNYLKEMSGAKVFITALPYTQEFQICHIEGSEEQVDCALELIRKKFKDLDVTNCYVQPPVTSLPSLSITSWLLLPHRVTVEVTVIQVASGNCVFLQQHKHPTFHALCSLDQNMSLCYSHPGCPLLPAPVEVGVICAAQMPEGAWWRAQVMGHHEETMVELRYVDYGGYDIVKTDTLRQIRSDFVALPFQGSEVILENIAPIPDFSAAAKSALEEMTRGLALLAQVTNCHTSGIPLVQIWRTEGEELVSVNRAMVDNGLCSWVDSP
ncbi:A-kinase anchor protein 1, mitochondrial-like isoform X45 [Oncorhynchus keta]|uniref:A-kinase anchor protein 1, mitochondrial-like isoform X45 n=1 Tax=Oncorhynchus keta TaxID=8018 RepID=UPI00227CF4E3|nr:A-kinase anchor protein 1, mitochondrial-like isoform X45 [Oncorhynchus keta]